MLRYLRLIILFVVVVAGVALPIANQAWLAWVAGGGFLLLLVLSHPALTRRIESREP